MIILEKITKEQLKEIERQLFNKARDMDVAIYNGLLDENNRDFVLDCLMMYRNSDGGFGHGLHIDNYDTSSSVYQTYEAFRILNMIHFDSPCKNPLFTELVNKACNYLFNKCLLEEGAWNPCSPTNQTFAHSEEFDYQKDFINHWGYHPAAALLGYALLFLEPTKAYCKKALRQIHFALDYLDMKEELSYYDFIGFNSLLGSLRKKGLLQEECAKIEAKLLSEAKKHLKEEGFKIYLMLSNCCLSKELEEKLNLELDQLIKQRASHGLWEHLQNWGKNTYPEADSASLKWLGAETVNTLSILLQFERVEL